MNPIPPDMNIHAMWARHDIVTDEMATYFKKSIGCLSYHGVMEVTEERFVSFFKKQVPEGKVAWLKKDRRNGAMNVYRDNMIFTNPNGSNPMVVKNFGGELEEIELMPLSN